MQAPSLDLAPLQPVLARHAPGGRTELIPVLLEAQTLYGWIPEPVASAIGQALRVPLAEIHGVIEFYTMLYSRPTARTIVRVCTSPVCAQAGAESALQAACRHLGVAQDEATADGKFLVERAECLGLCDHAPAALIGETPVAGIDPDSPASWIERPAPAALGHIGGEPRWLTGRCGEIEPTDVAAYEAHGGFAGLRKALKGLQPVDVVAMIKEAGLVGRGGAAFPTGLKWEYTAAAPGEVHYVVCNADESEPGTFKDRILMEGDPFSVIEGMAVAAYAIGARQGYLFVRGEYPRAQAILTAAIDAARRAGYLGEHILGSAFSFDVELRSGAGAYICGEETSLFEAIEGKRGFPRLKPPFPTTYGLFGKPTAINNVETLCAAAWIVAHGAQAYRSVGTADSPGSKLFCLSGDIVRPGVYEVPYGTSLRALIEQAGGARGELQAVLLGGAAGAFAGPDQLDLPMSFEGLRDAGLPLGSGVVMAINRQRDLRQTLLSLAHFFAHESCGKCFPCQLGTQRQLEILHKVADGNATEADVTALQDVGFAMTNASICGLGMTAATAVLSAQQQWPELFLNGAPRRK
ncbi:MAG TPA: NAD(P)H-dependent oxidoreductase subunit E [Anaerolineales bacterium]|nr:NAD(P)H-dependent oxidoreductase subunit E [Anaerolineales bacterium]